MLETQTSSAKSNQAAVPFLANEQMIAPIAKLWCRSFGVADDAAIARLTNMLAARAEEELAAGITLARIQSHLDESAAKIIRDWFSYLMGRDIPSDGKSLAILRLAFIDSNYDGKWSGSFLARDFCVQELSAELESMMIEPTPQAAPRVMVRQVF